MTRFLGSSGPGPNLRRSKGELAGFLRETLALELNPDKTLITHARTQRGKVPRI